MSLIPHGSHLVWTKHPWRTDNSGSKLPELKKDFDHHIRNMTWWNNYKPDNYQELPYRVGTTHSENKNIDDD